MPRNLIKLTWLLLSFAICVGACRDTRTGQVAALEDPQSLAAISGCFVVGDSARFVSVDSEDCTPQGRAYAAVIADPTNRWVQLASLDTRSFRLLSAQQRKSPCLDLELAGGQCVDRELRGARFVDYVPNVPGNSGITLPTEPTRVIESNIDGVVWVIGQNPRVLMAVDMIHHRTATFGGDDDVFALDFPVSDVVYLEGTQELIFADPQGRVLQRANASIVCNNDENDVGCELVASVSFDEPPVPLLYAPLFITSDSQSDIYISASDTRWVTRISLGDGDCPIDEPCRIPITWECNDGIDNDGDGLIDTDDESCFKRTDSETPIAYGGPPPECGDGVDSDGDGLADALDPGCGGRSDHDEADDSVWNSDTCDDGVDNDQDSLIDEDDPQCQNGSANEFGFGNIVEGSSGPAELPRYIRTPVFPGPLDLTPAGDILVVGERGGNRVELDRANEVLLACVNPPGEDADVGQPHLCQTANTLITSAVRNDRTREDYLGSSVDGTVTSIIAFDRLEEFRVTDDEGNGSVPLVENTRFAWATTSRGAIFSIIIDETLLWFADEAREEVTSGYVGVARLEDADRNNAEIRSLQRDLPDRFPFFAIPSGSELEVPSPTDEDFFPSLLAIAPYILSGQTATLDTRLDGVENARPAAFVQVEPEARFCFIGDGIEELGCLPRPPRDSGFQPFDFRRELSALPDGDVLPYEEDQRIVPNDFKIPDDEWTLEWEGSMLIGRSGSRLDTRRRDAVVLDDSGWVRFLSDEPCEQLSSDALCKMEFGWNACDEIEDLCRDDVDLCANDVSFCDICPDACETEVELCEAGVQPGDILVMPPIQTGQYCRAFDENCSVDSIPDQCLGGADRSGASLFGRPSNERVTYGNQFRIVEVDNLGVRVEPLQFEEDSRWPSPDRVPTPECARRPFGVEIIAADSWLLGGTRLYGHDTPYEEIDGQCRLRADGQTHVGRPQANEVWQDPSGLRFHIESGKFLDFCAQTLRPVECRHAMRGFRLRFTSEDRFSTRSIAGVGTLSIAAAYSPNLNLRFPLLMFLDMGSGSLFLIENDSSPASDLLR